MGGMPAVSATATRGARRRRACRCRRWRRAPRRFPARAGRQRQGGRIVGDRAGRLRRPARPPPTSATRWSTEPHQLVPREWMIVRPRSTGGAGSSCPTAACYCVCRVHRQRRPCPAAGDRPAGAFGRAQLPRQRRGRTPTIRQVVEIVAAALDKPSRSLAARRAGHAGESDDDAHRQLPPLHAGDRADRRARLPGPWSGAARASPRRLAGWQPTHPGSRGDRAGAAGPVRLRRRGRPHGRVGRPPWPSWATW